MQDFFWKLFMGGIIAMMVSYLVYFFKIVVEYMREASLGMTTFYPL